MSNIKVNAKRPNFSIKDFPLIGFGCYFGNVEAVSPEVIQRSAESAVDTGFRHFDTALIYNTEIPLGRALHNKIKAGVIRRQDIFVTSKLPWDSHHPDHVREAFHQSLTNLGLEYLDLYLIHWPAPVIKNSEEPLPSRPFDHENGYIKVWKVLEELVKQGLVRHIGLSNFNSRQVENVLEHCRIKPLVNQCEVHLYLQNRQLIQHNNAKGVTVVAFTPLGIGQGSCDGWEIPLKEPVLQELADKYMKTPAQISLKFLVQQGIPVLSNSNNPQHQAENLQIFDFEIQEEDMQKLKSLDRNQRRLKLDKLKDHKEYPFSDPF